MESQLGKGARLREVILGRRIRRRVSKATTLLKFTHKVFLRLSVLRQFYYLCAALFCRHYANQGFPPAISAE